MLILSLLGLSFCVFLLSPFVSVSLSLTLQSCWLHSGLGRLQLLPWPSACVRRCLSEVFWDIAKSMTSSTPPLPNFFNSSAFRLSKSVVTEIVTLHRPTRVHYCTVYSKKKNINWSQNMKQVGVCLQSWTNSCLLTFWNNKNAIETLLISTDPSGDMCVSPYTTLTR